MTEQRIPIVVDLAGNLLRRSRQFGSAMRRLNSETTQSLRSMEGAARRTNTAFGGRRFLTGAAIAAGVTQGARAFASLEERLVRLAIQSEITDERLAGIKSRLFEVANLSDIRVGTTDILSGIEQIVTQTGDLEAAVSNMENIARTIQASGSAGEDVGALIANIIEKFNVRDADQVLAVLDSLLLQGKAGAFELKDMATQGNRVSAAYAATGRTGARAALEMGALLQMVRRNTGSAEEAATAFERLLAALTQEKVQDLQKKGIKIWDADELAKGNKVARSIPDIIRDIVKATKGDPEKLATIFDTRAMRAILAFSLENQKTGGFESLDNFLNINGSGQQLIADSARAASIATSAWQELATTARRTTDELLGPMIKQTSGLFNMFEQLPDSRPDIADRIGAAVAHTMALFGDKGAKIAIELRRDGGARVLELQSSPGLDVEIDTGRMMGD